MSASLSGISLSRRAQVCHRWPQITTHHRTRSKLHRFRFVCRDASRSVACMLSPMCGLTDTDCRNPRVGTIHAQSVCKRRREIVALGGGKVQRLGCGKDSLERGWRLVARGLFIDSTLHQSRLSPSSVFFSSHHEVGSSGRRLRGCGSGASDDPESHLSVVRC